METFDELKRAVRKLRHRVTELEGGPARKAQAEVDAIVGGSDPHGRGRFSAELDRSRRGRRDVAVGKLQDELVKKPWLVDSSSGVGEIRARFGKDIPTNEIDKLVNVVYNDRHHHPSNVEKRFSGAAEVMSLISTGLDTSDDDTPRKRSREPGF